MEALRKGRSSTYSSGRETLAQRIAALQPTARIVRPAGEGRLPVVIQLHGCGGLKKLQGRYAETARASGWASVTIDSYAHRRISSLEAYATVCTGLQLWGRERAGDIFATMAWLRDQPWADADRLALAGWSHGGWTVLDAMALAPGRDAEAQTRLAGLPEEPLAGLVGAFVVYPYQGPGALAPRRGLRVDAPVAAIVGTADAVVGGRSLAARLDRTRTVGQPISVTVLEGATHAFDEAEAQDWRVRYHPELAARAHALYADFLTKAAERRSLVASAGRGPPPTPDA